MIEEEGPDDYAVAKARFYLKEVYKNDPSLKGSGEKILRELGQLQGFIYEASSFNPSSMTNSKHTLYIVDNSIYIRVKEKKGEGRAAYPPLSVIISSKNPPKNGVCSDLTEERVHRNHRFLDVDLEPVSKPKRSSHDIRKYQGDAYLSKRLVGPNVAKMIKHVSDQSKYPFAARSIIAHLMKNGECPIPSRLMQDEFNIEDTANIWDYEGSPIIATSYDKGNNICRSYRLSNSFWSLYTELYDNDDQIVDPVTFKKKHNKPLKCTVLDANDNKIVKDMNITHKAIKHLERTPHYMNMHLLQLYTNKMSATITKRGATQEEINRAINHLRSFSVIDRQRWDGRKIHNAYKIQMKSGRLTYRQGGPQALRRPVKQVIYRHLKDVHNYDIKSSQTSAMRFWANKLGMDTAALDNYPGKTKAAEYCSLRKEEAKTIEHAIKFGAALPKNLKQKCAINREVNLNNSKLKRVKQVYAPLKKFVYDLSETLSTDYYEENKKRGSWSIVNPAGIRWKKKNRPAFRRRVSVMVWALQGLEAAFIHHITTLGKDYYYNAFANEHDGVITKGEISDGAIEEARELTGWHSCKLVKKDFADYHEVVEAWDGILSPKDIKKLMYCHK